MVASVRHRLWIDTDEQTRRAFAARAALEGVGGGALLRRLLELYCPAELDRARELGGRSQDASDGVRSDQDCGRLANRAGA